MLDHHRALEVLEIAGVLTTAFCGCLLCLQYRVLAGSSINVTLADEILAYLGGAKWPLTARQVGVAIGSPPSHVKVTLNRLYERGKVRKFEGYAGANKGAGYEVVR